jgi:hypothetical protein
VKSITLSFNPEQFSQDSSSITNRQDGPYKHLIWISGPSLDSLLIQEESDDCYDQEEEAEEIQADIIQEPVEENLDRESYNTNDKKQALLKKTISYPGICGQYSEGNYTDEFNLFEEQQTPHHILRGTERIMEDQQRHIEILNDHIYHLDLEMRDLAAENTFLRSLLNQEKGHIKGKVYAPHFQQRTTYQSPASYWGAPYVGSYPLSPTASGASGLYSYYYDPQYYRSVKI